MSKVKKNVKNRGVSLILASLLSIFFLITSITLVVYRVVLSEAGIIASLRVVDYHEGVYERLRYRIGDILLPTGLPHQIIDDAFTPADVYVDLSAFVSAMFANYLPTFYRSAIAERLNDNIDYYLLEIGLSRAEVGDEAIGEIVEAIINNYNDYIGSPLLSFIVRTSHLFNTYLRLLLVIGVVAILITMETIYLLSRRFKHLTIRYFAFSFGATAFMLIVAPLAVRIWGGYHRLGITPEFVYNFVVTHIDRTISSLLLVGAIFAGLYLLFIIISTILRRRAVVQVWE